MIGGITVAEVSAKTAEAGKLAAVEKTAVDIGKRVDVTEKVVESKSTGVDIAKRVTPDVLSSALENKGCELSPEQVKELISRGMSPSLAEGCTVKDGIYQMKTLNDKLADMTHPESGVNYIKKVIDLAGKRIEGVFPQFESIFTVQLPEEKLLATDYIQFKECTEKLQLAIENNPSLKEQFSPRQLEQIAQGIVPGRYTWHHNEEVGKMELVDAEKHNSAAHTGGKAIWGGGTDAR